MKAPLALALLAAASMPLQAETGSCGAATLAMLEAIKRSDYDAAVADFSEDMRANLTADRLRQTMAGIQEKLGPIERFGTHSGGRVVTVPVFFRDGALDARAACDGATNRLTGFRLLPRQPQTMAPHKPPAYAVPGSYRETEMVVGPHRLGGILAMPKGTGPFPAVVLVHGSGPHDRDGTMGPNKPLADLAVGLASRGVASLRYDKRTHARPESFAGGAVTLEAEVHEDALAAVSLLRATKGVDSERVFIAGHSFGAAVAPTIAARAPVRGMILLAPPAVRLDRAIERQTRHIVEQDGNVSEAERRHLAQLDVELERLRKVAAGEPPGGPLPLGAPAGYWKELLGLDPIGGVRASKLPVLLIQGGRDYQVTVSEDLRLWQAAFSETPRVTIKRYDALNHIFQPGSGPSSPAEYGAPGAVDEGVVRDIADWIGRN